LVEGLECGYGLRRERFLRFGNAQGRLFAALIGVLPQGIHRGVGNRRSFEQVFRRAKTSSLPGTYAKL